MTDKIKEIREQLYKERDLIDERLELLDQYEAVGEANPLIEAFRAEHPQKKVGKGKKPKKKVVKRTARTPRLKPDPKDRRKPKGAKKPRATTPLKPVKETGPVMCGMGDKEIKEGSSTEMIVKAIGDRSPRWVSHDGIVEAAEAMGLNPPKSFLTITWDKCRKLRKAKYRVPGLEYRMRGRRIEYRIAIAGGLQPPVD